MDGLDERCDVFGLGAILCEILTGAPPYRGRDVGELLRKAARADLGDALGRLDGCGAETELVQLAKACLAAEPSHRPRDGGAAAAAMTAYLAGVQERLRKAELERAAAQARAEEALARPRRSGGRDDRGAGDDVAAGSDGGRSGGAGYQHDRAARAAEDARQASEHARKAAATERDVTAALEEATVFGKQAAGLHDDPAKWEEALVEALSAVKRADGVLNSGEGGDDLRGRGRCAGGVGIGGKGPAYDRPVGGSPFPGGGRRQGEWVRQCGAAVLYTAAFRQDDKDWDSLAPDEAAAHQPASHWRRPAGGTGRLVQHYAEQRGGGETSRRLAGGGPRPRLPCGIAGTRLWSRKTWMVRAA